MRYTKYQKSCIEFSADDARKSTFHILRYLLRNGYRCTLFLCAEIGLPKDELLTVEQVRQLLDLGLELGSHGYCHYDLTSVGPQTLVMELKQSKEFLSAKFSVPITKFAYPFGSCNQLVLDCVPNYYQLAYVSTPKFRGNYQRGRIDISNYQFRKPIRFLTKVISYVFTHSNIHYNNKL